MIAISLAPLTMRCDRHLVAAPRQRWVACLSGLWWRRQSTSSGVGVRSSAERLDGHVVARFGSPRAPEEIRHRHRPQLSPLELPQQPVEGRKRRLAVVVEQDDSARPQLAPDAVDERTGLGVPPVLGVDAPQNLTHPELTRDCVDARVSAAVRWPEEPRARTRSALDRGRRAYQLSPDSRGREPDEIGMPVGVIGDLADSRRAPRELRVALDVDAELEESSSGS
jgi:hypothetical protein